MSNNRYQEYDESMEELGELQVEVDDLREELKTKNTTIDDLTFELDELSKVCSDMDKQLEDLLRKVKNEGERFERYKKATDSIVSELGLEHSKSSSASPNIEFMKLRRAFFEENGGKLPILGHHSVKMWLLRKMLDDDTMELIVDPKRLEYKAKALYFYLLGQIDRLRNYLADPMREELSGEDKSD
jgi:hypothetical protein